MANVVHLEFDDGTSADVEVRPVLMVQAERHYKGQVPPIEGTLWACWKRLKPGSPFDVWLETVASMNESEEGSTPAPLDEAPSPDS